MFHHRALGLEIGSDIELKVLSKTTRAEPRVCFFTGASPKAISDNKNAFIKKNHRGIDYLSFAHTPAEDAFTFEYWDKTHFQIECGKDDIRVYGQRPDDTSLPYYLTYLTGPILGYAARLCEKTVLHASAIEHEGKALVFCGHGGAGKSSIATSFGLDDKTILTDDLCALHFKKGRAFVEPGPRRIRLWKESEEALFDDALPHIAPDWDKRFVDKQVRFGDEPLEVGAFYILTHAGTPRLLSPMTGTLSLLAQIYAHDFSTVAMKKRDLDALSKACENIPVFALPKNQSVKDIATRKADALNLYASR